MKRTHAAAFEKDVLARLPKECEDLVFEFLSVLELCKSLAPVSSRMKAIAYEGKNWRKIQMVGMQNHRMQQVLRLHGRKMHGLICYGMRISRAACKLFSKCSVLQSLDLTGIWKSTAIDKRFVAAISVLPLKRLLFGLNEVCDEGFNTLCRKMSSLEELDFNSKKVSARSLYNVCMLTNLRSLCFRSCNNANEDTVRSLCRLPKLKTLQLSFLPMVHCASLKHLYVEEHGLKDRLQTLVLNGMFLTPHRIEELSSLRKLRVLSVCHSKINSNDLELLRLPLLEILTIFCSNELESFNFLSEFPVLKTLCLYRCAFSNRSLMRWVQRRPGVEFRLFTPRPLRRGGEVRADEPLDYERFKNLKKLRLMRRPYPMFF